MIPRMFSEARKKALRAEFNEERFGERAEDLAVLLYCGEPVNAILDEMMTSFREEKLSPEAILATDIDQLRSDAAAYLRMRELVASTTSIVIQ